jgi:hypothetical protein
VRRNKEVTMKYEKLSGCIIGSAMRVLNELKPGLDERVYENALVWNCRNRESR